MIVLSLVFEYGQDALRERMEATGRKDLVKVFPAFLAAPHRFWEAENDASSPIFSYTLREKSNFLRGREESCRSLCLQLTQR